MNRTVVVGMARTPFGKFGGALSSFTAAELGAIAINEAIIRSKLEREMIDYVYMGHVLQAGCGQMPVRQATRLAGLPWETVSTSINKVCSSGMSAVAIGDMMIRLGQAKAVVAGGMESMSNVPYAIPKARFGARLGDTNIQDLMVMDGLWCAFYDRHMAVHGSEVSKEFGISRQEQDEWAVRSHLRASDAINEGRMKDEDIPIKVKTKKGTIVVDADESVRPNTTLEVLSKLPSIFIENGTVTAGNAPGVNDGAAALVLMPEQEAKNQGIPILATIIGHEEVSQEARYIATVPALSAIKLLKRHSVNIQDIDIIEVNEAFAAVALISNKIVGWKPERVNVDGGAIAIGHPLGASGARIMIHTIQALRERGGGLGLACICSGAAQGNAILIRVE